MYRPVTNLWQSVVANLPMPYITSLQSAYIEHDAWNLCQALFHLAELEVVSKGIWFLSWLNLGPWASLSLLRRESQIGSLQNQEAQYTFSTLIFMFSPIIF